MGAPRGGTDTPFGVNRPSRKIEGDPEKSANKKGKGKNGGSNDASSASARTNYSLLPPETGSRRGNRSRTSSVANTPTSSPQTSPETKKEILSRVVGLLISGVEGGSTDTEDRECFGKQSTNTSPHTSPPKPQPSSLQGSSPPLAQKPVPQTITSLQGKQENVKPAALPTSDLPTPPTSPEIQSQTMPVALEDGSAPSVFGNPSGLADMDKQDDVKSVVRPSPDTFTPPASPETRNLAVQADLGKGPAASLLEPQAA